MAGFALAILVVMFVIVFVARSVIQKRRTGDTGLRAGALGASAGGTERLAGWMLVLALVLALAAPIAELGGLAPWTDDPSVRGAGAAIAIVGTILTFVAQLSMGDQWRIGVDSKERTQLVTDGMFSVVRNPIFSALIVAAVGLALMVPNVLAAIGVGLLVASIELQVRGVEEPYLRSIHGTAYEAYSARVGRLVPGIGRV